MNRIEEKILLANRIREEICKQRKEIAQGDYEKMTAQLNGIILLQHAEDYLRGKQSAPENLF